MLTMPTLQIMITPFQDTQWYLAKAASPGHPSTALSTGEAEYYAVTHAGHKVIWLWQLLTEIGFAPHIETTLHIDNTFSICMIETPDQVTNCTKHINIAYHWIHEEVQKQNIVPGYVPSEQNISDIFTKGFHAPHHKELASALRMDLRADASWGGVLNIYMYIDNLQYALPVPSTFWMCSEHWTNMDILM
jgi:hypothetical protein